MASKKTHRKKEKRVTTLAQKSLLKAGDQVVVIAGGHKEKRPNKGKVGTLKSFTGRKMDRVFVEGVNMITVNQRQSSPDKPHGRIKREGSIHISNVLFYVEKLEKGVRLKSSFLNDGKKVRGYLDPESKEFVQV